MSATVLLGEADPFNLRLLQEVCEAAGFHVITAGDGPQVLDVLARDRPDVVLLDVHLPDKDGLEVLRILKADPGLSPIPVLLVTPPSDIESRSRGIELGAEDYVSKPYRVFEIQRRLRNALRTVASKSQFPRESMPPVSLVDPATRAGTSLQLTMSLDYEYTRAQRYGHPLAYVVVRVSNFDEVVDEAVAGDGPQITRDEFASRLAMGLRLCIRSVDQLFRSRDHQFGLLLPETGPAGAKTVLERVTLRAGDGTLWEGAIGTVPVVELGWAACPSPRIDSGEALHAAACAELSRAELS